MRKANCDFHVTFALRFRVSGNCRADRPRSGTGTCKRSRLGDPTPSHTCLSSPMKLNTPLPQPLPKECAKAARICEFPSLTFWTTQKGPDPPCAVKSFVDHGNNGLDGVRSFIYGYWLCLLT